MKPLASLSYFFSSHAFAARYTKVWLLGVANRARRTNRLPKQLLRQLFRPRRRLDLQFHKRVLRVDECPLCSSLHAALLVGFVDMVSEADALGLPAIVAASWLLEPSCPPCIDECCEDGSVFLVIFIFCILFSVVAVGQSRRNFGAPNSSTPSARISSATNSRNRCVFNDRILKP